MIIFGKGVELWMSPILAPYAPVGCLWTGAVGWEMSPVFRAGAGIVLSSMMAQLILA
jgi:hypothetical protein